LGAAGQGRAQNRSPNGSFSLNLGTWPIHSTRFRALILLRSVGGRGCGSSCIECLGIFGLVGYRVQNMPAVPMIRIPTAPPVPMRIEFSLEPSRARMRRFPAVFRRGLLTVPGLAAAKSGSPRADSLRTC